MANFNPANYIDVRDACELLKVQRLTIYNYIKKGRIRSYKLSPKKLLVNRDDVRMMLNLPSTTGDMNVVYARVSKQCDTEKLNEQVVNVTTFAIKNGISIDKVYADVCPSYQFGQKQRPHFYELLKDINKCNIKNIYIQSPDRITRFGSEIFDEICKYNKVKIIYLTPNIIDNYYKDEVRDEVLVNLKQLKEMYEI